MVCLTFLCQIRAVWFFIERLLDSLSGLSKFICRRFLIIGYFDELIHARKEIQRKSKILEMQVFLCTYFMGRKFIISVCGTLCIDMIEKYSLCINRIYRNVFKHAEIQFINAFIQFMNACFYFFNILCVKDHSKIE